MAFTKNCSICSKSQIFRNNLEELLWHTPRHVSLLPKRRTRLPLLLLPRNLYLHSHSLPIGHSILLPRPRLLPLLRTRAPSLSPPMSSLTSPPAESSSTPTTKTERVVIKGRVQGVSYRYWTVENATELGLKGWVRNRRDGSVEALFSGPSEKVEEMQQRCRRGPRIAMVTGLEAFPGNEDPGTGFECRPTV